MSELELTKRWSEELESVGWLLMATNAGGLSSGTAPIAVGSVHRYLQKELFDKIIKPALIGVAIADRRDGFDSESSAAYTLVDEQWCTWRYETEINTLSASLTVDTAEQTVSVTGNVSGEDKLLVVGRTEWPEITGGGDQMREEVIVDQFAELVNCGRINSQKIALFTASIRGNERRNAVVDEVIRPILEGIASQDTDNRNQRVVSECVSIIS